MAAPAARQPAVCVCTFSAQDGWEGHTATAMGTGTGNTQAGRTCAAPSYVAYEVTGTALAEREATSPRQLELADGGGEQSGGSGGRGGEGLDT